MTANDSVFHYTPNRSFVFSRDWDLRLVNQGWVNNAGMVNNQDYQKDETTPLLAIVGDSFIEALMVPYNETVQGRLAKALDRRLRVYSFGASGAPMSQYLIWGREAVRDYHANALIINIVGNDFDESHDAYKRDFPGYWIYVPDPDGQLRLKLFEFNTGLIRSLVKYSALGRYVFVNLHAKTLSSEWNWFHAPVAPEISADTPRYAGNTVTDADSARVDASLAVIDAFFRDLPQVVGLPPERVTFTMDGFRYPDEAVKGAGTYFDLMRRAFREKAEAKGYEVIDTDPLFFSHFRQHAQRFEDSRDHHWNATAHGIIANAIMSSKLIKRISIGYQ